MSPDDIKINPKESLINWYKRITMPGKYSTLQVDSFERLINNIQHLYTHARHLPEPFTIKVSF